MLNRFRLKPYNNKFLVEVCVIDMIPYLLLSDQLAKEINAGKSFKSFSMKIGSPFAKMLNTPKCVTFSSHNLHSKLFSFNVNLFFKTFSVMSLFE